MWSQWSLKLSSFLFICFSDQCQGFPLSSSSLIHFSISFNLLLILSNAFSSQLLYSSSLFDSLLHFLTLC